MLNNLYFLILSFELILYLLMMLTLGCTQVEQRNESAILLLKSSLPITLVLLLGAVLLSASVGSTHLDFIHDYLQGLSLENGQTFSFILPALGIILIVVGIAFRMGVISTNFRSKRISKEVPYWILISSVLVTVCAGSFLLVIFVNQITVSYFGYTEQLLFFIALIVLCSTAGLLMVEKELKTILVLIVMQMTGVFFAQLSAMCWKWRHESIGEETLTFLEVMQAFAPNLLFSYLAVLGLACLLDCLGDHKSEIIYQDQLRGLILDQCLLGSAAIFFLCILMGFPGLSAFQMRWPTLLSLFEIHQESTLGMMATMHLGYLGLAVLIMISSAIVAFTCARMMLQICFDKPITRYRHIKHKKAAVICYFWVICLLIYNFKMIANF